MLDEYLALGGVELGNNARAYAYAECLSCCAGLLKCPGCDGIHDATNPWTDAVWEWQTRAVNLAPDPRATSLTFLPSSPQFTNTLIPPDGVRAERTATGTGRVASFIVGTAMPHAGETITLRFNATATSPFTAVTVVARPDITSAAGELQIAQIAIPEGESVVEVTGPSYTGTVGANSGLVLVDAASAVGDALNIATITIQARPPLDFTERRRNWAVGSGAFWSKTTGTVVGTKDGAATPSVVVATNLMTDPSARSAGVAGGAFITDSAVSGAALTRVTAPAALPGAEYAAHFQVSATTYRIGFVVGTALAASTQYTIRFRMAGNPTVAADGTTVPLTYRPGGATATGGQVIIGNFPVRATESVVQATFTTLSNVPLASAAIVFAQTNGRVAGGVLDITEVTLVAGAGLPSAPGPFFDGTTPDTAEYQYDWTGTADLSTSRATLLPVVVPNGTLRLTQTVQGTVTWWDSFSIRMLGTTSTSQVPVTEGQIIRLRAAWRGNDRRRIRFQYVYYDATGTALGSTTSVYAPPASTPLPGEWAEFTYEMPPVPAGAATVWLNVNSGQPGNASDTNPAGFTNGDWMEFRNFQVAIDQELEPYFDGSTLAPDGYTQYRWTGAAWASASVQMIAQPLSPIGPYFDGDTLPAEADPTLSRVEWLGEPNASASQFEVYTLITPAASTGEPPYDCSALSFAPWYDQDNPASQRLAGFYLLAVSGATDSTMTATVTEGLDDGGVIGAQRNASRTIRVREMIVACGMDAAEYGLAWLKAALSETFCGRHGDACGTADLDFFIDCPPSLDFGDPDYQATTTRYRRFLHGVGATSGPIIVDQFETDSGAYVIIVEFILTAESPFVWGETLDIAGTGQTLTAYDDIPFNLMRYPSGEVGDGVPAVVATQYVFNGSVEFGATGWAHQETAIPAGITAGQSTDIAAVGPNSYRVRLLATGAVTDGTIGVYYDVPLGALPAGSKPSVSMWGAALVFAGAPTVGTLGGKVEWRTASATVSETPLGTVPMNGGNLLGKGLTIPATATVARLWLTASDVDAIAADDLRVYADAFALTVP